jgi:flagellar hook-length control protein FliK
MPRYLALRPADAADVPVAEASDEPKTPASDSEAQTGAQPVLASAPRELRKAAAEAPVVRIALDQPAPQQKVSIADITQNQRQAAAIPAPISQPIADQIVAAFELPQTRTSRAAADPQVDLSTLAASATGTQTAAAVTATGPGQDAMLDTRDQQWTAKMIDKIEALQGGGPVRETRLSLMPEGLGKVDISIRQDDAGLHVQFNTDTQAARQLIADAQPKLAEIAQERGIRLGSTSVESNATGTGAGTANPQMNQGQRNDAQPQRNQPSPPPSARREAQSSTNSDERVA